MLLPTKRQNQEIEELFKLLELLDTVTKDLQSDTISIAEAHELFGEAIQDFPCTERRLYFEAEILYSSPFETAVEKIQRGRSFNLTVEESRSVFNFKKFDKSATEEGGKICFSLTTLALKRFMKEKNK